MLNYQFAYGPNRIACVAPARWNPGAVSQKLSLQWCRMLASAHVPSLKTSGSFQRAAPAQALEAVQNVLSFRGMSRPCSKFGAADPQVEATRSPRLALSQRALRLPASAGFLPARLSYKNLPGLWPGNVHSLSMSSRISAARIEHLPRTGSLGQARPSGTCLHG